MKKIIQIIAVSLLCVFLFTGCQKSIVLDPDQIQSDMLAFGAFHSKEASVSNLTIQSQGRKGMQIDILVSAAYSTSDFTASSEFNLIYQIQKDKAVLSSVTESNKSLSVNLMTDVSQAAALVKGLHYNQSSPYYKLVEADKTFFNEAYLSRGDFETGKATLIYEDYDSCGAISILTDYTVTAIYVLGTGWTYEFTDWKTTTVMDLWSGWVSGFDFTWNNNYADLYDIPHDSESSYFKIGSVFDHVYIVE